MKTLVVACVLVFVAASAGAAGHGPVFGATTPTLGRGGWSLDQAWTLRSGEDDTREQMVKTMISYGITENLQVSGSVPLVTNSGDLASVRMMSLMSSDQEVEGIVGYRFQRRIIGVGGRQESTVYVGGTAPLEHTRNGTAVSPSLYLSAATGYASRSHYVWVGGGVQEFFERDADRVGGSRFVSAVYGFRPKPLRVESNKPDARLFVEAVAEDRLPDRVAGIETATGARSVFVGPTTLILYKAYAFEGGVLFPAYQQVDAGRISERVRVAVNVSYFFWLK